MEPPVCWCAKNCVDALDREDLVGQTVLTITRCFVNCQPSRCLASPIAEPTLVVIRILDGLDHSYPLRGFESLLAFHMHGFCLGHTHTHIGITR